MRDAFWNKKRPFFTVWKQPFYIDEILVSAKKYLVPLVVSFTNHKGDYYLGIAGNIPAIGFHIVPVIVEDLIDMLEGRLSLFKVFHRGIPFFYYLDTGNELDEYNVDQRIDMVEYTCYHTDLSRFDNPDEGHIVDYWSNRAYARKLRKKLEKENKKNVRKKK